MLRILIARNSQELERLRPTWESLYRSSPRTLFQSYHWNAISAAVFAGRESPLVVLVEDGNGGAIVPACRAGGTLSLLGDRLFDYRDVLAVGDNDIIRLALERLADCGLPVNVECLYGEKARARWSELGFAPEPFVTAPYVTRADIAADTFAHRHSRSARLLRRLTRLGAVLREYPGTEGQLVRYLYQAKGAQPTGALENLFSDPLRREFMTRICAAEPACEIFTLEAGSTLVSALVTFRDASVRRFYTTYYDHAWAHHSPGMALLYEVTRRSLESGLDCDYMTGEQPHKTRLATGSVPLFRVHAPADELARLAGERRALAA